MRQRMILTGMAALLVAGMAHNAMAQCPAVTDVSPTIIGRTIHPPTAYSYWGGDASDGETVTIDSGGANLVFEFDTNGSTTPGNIAVTIPAPPGNRDAARTNLELAINSEPSSPCTATAYYSAGFPEYMTLIWNDEASGYGADNTDTAANINFNDFAMQGNERSFVLLEGTDLDQVTSVRLESTTSADVISGTDFYHPGDGSALGFQVVVVPDFSNPLTSAPALGDYDIVIESGCGTLTIPAGVTIVENLLNDGTFMMHFLGNTNYNGCGGLGSWDVFPGPLWEHDNTPGTGISVWDVRDKAQLYTVSCQREDPWPVNDYIWMSITSNQPGRHEARQTIPVNFTEETAVTIRGMYAGGTAALMDYGVEVRNQGGTLLFQDGPHTTSTWIAATPPNNHWADFAVTGTVPAGTTELEVTIYADNSQLWNGFALHIDDLLMFEGTLCDNPPAITSVTPGYGVRDTSVVVTVDGNNFVAGDTNVTLFRGSTEIQPTNVNVLSSTSLTATFDLTDVGRDYWGVSVQNPDCPTATLADAFNVVLPGPDLTNGGFELPEYVRPDPCQYGTRTDVVSDDWTSIHITPYGGGAHYRDDLVNYSLFGIPTCLPPEGLHWASVSSPYGSYAGMRRYTQTVTVNPGSTYTLSGYFAAGGPNNLSISLLEGGYDGSVIASETVLQSGDKDWTFGYVTGSVIGDLITAVWDTDNDDVGDKVGHADDLVLEECTSAVAVGGVTPTVAASEETLSGVLITGSGFTGSPLVYLVREGTTLEATSVVVNDDTEMVCEFDMIGGGFGWLDLIVGNNGCYATLEDAVFTAPAVILNPEFEDPTVIDSGTGLPADPCLGTIEGAVSVWQADDPSKFRRDDTVLADALTCPNPNTAGGHYGSLSTDQAESLRVYQTVKVVPGKNYLVGAWFAGGGGATVDLMLVEGVSPDNTVIASSTVMQTSGVQQQDWQLGTVTGPPNQEFMTIVWQLTGSGDIAASHADGFYMESPCNTPFADVDQDNDVDQADFAVFQLCYTRSLPNAIPIPTEPEYCGCLDVEGGVDGGDGDIDQADLSKFADCATGPSVQWQPSPNCPN